MTASYSNIKDKIKAILDLNKVDRITKHIDAHLVDEDWLVSHLTVFSRGHNPFNFEFSVYCNDDDVEAIKRHYKELGWQNVEVEANPRYVHVTLHWN